MKIKKENCKSNNIRLTKKNTTLDYTKKIRFLVRTYVLLASFDQYITEITNNMNLEEGTTNIEKHYVYKRNTRSKVLIVFSIEDEA